jgi:hypothetical protein
MVDPIIRTRRALLCAPLLAGPVIGLTRPGGTTSLTSQEWYVYWLSDAKRCAIRSFGDTVLDRIADWQLGHGTRKDFQNLASPLWWSSRGADFLEVLSRVRAPLGLVRERVESGIDGGFRRLPNLPLGSYAIATWDVRLEKNPYIYTEQLTLASPSRDLQGWVLCGYYLSPKPYLEY